MNLQTRLLHGTLSDLYAHASTRGYMTVADQSGLIAALLDDSLSDEEKRSINRLLRAICKGRLKVVNESSN